MIDIHCHILPGIDDGAHDLEESLAMSQIAFHDGINVIVATPHTMNGVYINDRNAIHAEVKKLQEAIIEKEIDLTILPGADVHVNYNMLDLIHQGNVITINDNGRYLLLEFPPYHVPPNIEKFIFNLKTNGITSIISHPERNRAIQNDLYIIIDLVKQGVLTQITSMSLTGEFGQLAYNCAIDMLEHNLAHIIATDAHSSSFRMPLLSEAVEKATEIVGVEFANAMVTTIPEAIIKGENPPLLPEPRIPKKSFFRRRMMKAFSDFFSTD